MAESVPEVFAPFNLRNKVLYRNLSKHSFTVDEKTFIGSEAGGITSLLIWGTEKNAILRRIATRHSIPVSTVREWMNKVARSLPITNKIGRPSAMDEEAIQKFQNTLELQRTVKNAVPFAETVELLGVGATETKMRQGKRGAAAISIMCPTTQKKLFKQCHVVKVKPQILTDARNRACRCPRISYIWGCVCMAYSSNLRAEQKWNADATTIVISESGTGSYVCVIKDNHNTDPVSSSALPDNLNLLVKWFALNNAGGESGPLVLIFAVPTMEEGTYFATQVLSMGSTSAIGEKGWLYCAKTRGGCPDMWIHYCTHITVPTIQFSNDCHKHKVRYNHELL